MSACSTSSASYSSLPTDGALKGAVKGDLLPPIRSQDSARSATAQASTTTRQELVHYALLATSSCLHRGSYQTLVFRAKFSIQHGVGRDRLCDKMMRWRQIRSTLRATLLCPAGHNPRNMYSNKGLTYSTCCCPHLGVLDYQAPALSLALKQAAHQAETSVPHAAAPEQASASAAGQHSALQLLLNHPPALLTMLLGSCCHAGAPLAAAAVR